MAKSRVEINQDSDAKRGMVSKSYKLHKDTADLIDSLAEKQAIAKGALIAEAIKLYADQLKSS